jgi:hypothetical protein
VKKKKMIEVRNGVNSIPIEEIEGKEVHEIRSMLSQALNIDTAAVPTVNGETVNENYVLVDGDELEFVKPSGEKGI